MKLSKKSVDQILQRLSEKRVRVQCELCESNSWSIVEVPIGLTVSPTFVPFIIPPQRVDVVGLVCGNCGNLRLLALGPLGVVPEFDQEQEQKP